MPSTAENSRVSWAGNAALLVIVLLAIAGCSAGSWLNNPPADETPEPASNGNPYLTTMETLGDSDPAAQAELFQRIYRAYLEAPTTGNRLQLALAYAAPGHPSYDPAESQKLLRQLQASPETLSPIERQLVDIELAQVEQALVLRSEILALRSTSQRDAEQLRITQRQQTERLNAQIRTLRRQLAEAQEKLDAISSLERSIIPGNGQETGADN